MFKRMRSERGFTLVELLVVLAIIAILVAIVVPNLTGLLTGTKQTAMKQERDVVLNAIDSYYTQDYKVNNEAAIPGATGFFTLAKDDGTMAFTRYLRRDTKYFYSWNDDGVELWVCDGSSGPGTDECYP